MGQLPKKVGGRSSNTATKTKTTTERGYGADWQKIRLTVMARYDGLCAACRNAWAVHVHHMDRDTSNVDTSNLLPLCRACHQDEHREHKA